MQVIPAINEKDFQKIREKIKTIESLNSSLETGWVQLDVADGTFTGNSIWHNAPDLFALETKLNIELHLMVRGLDKKISDWFAPCVRRIIFHLEAAENPMLVIEEIRKSGREAGLAINPETPWPKAIEYAGKVGFFQFLAVPPGLPGQTMKKDVLDKIKEMKSSCPSCIIEVDGGINLDTAKMAKVAGADIVAAASAVFENPDTEKIISEFKKI